jgi:hypothetical protein
VSLSFYPSFSSFFSAPLLCVLLFFLNFQSSAKKDSSQKVFDALLGPIVKDPETGALCNRVFTAIPVREMVVVIYDAGDKYYSQYQKGNRRFSVGTFVLYDSPNKLIYQTRPHVGALLVLLAHHIDFFFVCVCVTFSLRPSELPLAEQGQSEDGRGATILQARRHSARFTSSLSSACLCVSYANPLHFCDGATVL